MQAPQAPTTALRLLHLSDTHLFADPTGRLQTRCCAEELERVLEHIAQGPAHDAALITGDLVHDETLAGYERLATLLQRLDCPCYALCGNHDDPRALAQVAHPRLSAAPMITLGDWRVLQLNSQVPQRPEGYLAESELNRLRAALQATPEHPTLIAVHHQPLPIDSPWMDAMRIGNAEALFDILAPYPQVRGMLCGHVHQPWEGVYRGIPIWAAPSTCLQFRPRSQTSSYTDAPPGYRSLTLQPDGTLTTEVHYLD